MRRRRRFQSLGLSDQRRRRLQNQRQSASEKFIAERRGKDLMLYHHLAVTNPEKVLQLEDEVDWELEYCCDVMLSWIVQFFSTIFGWIPLCLAWVGNLRRAKCCNKGDDGSGTKGPINESPPKPPPKPPPSPPNPKFDLMTIGKYRMWRYNNCVPFVQRRILKRKWLCKPETKAWAEKSMQLFREHVNRGFRTCCSKIGKNAKIYVGNFIFYGDQDMLSLSSELFRSWFDFRGNTDMHTEVATLQEMQGIMVYIYTLTWPTNMMTKDGEWEGKTCLLTTRFMALLTMYGIPLSLMKHHPYEQQNNAWLMTKGLRCATKALSAEDILWNSIFHPSVQRYASGMLSLEDGGGSDYSFNMENFRYSPMPRQDSILPYHPDTLIRRRSFRDTFRLSREPRVQLELQYFKCELYDEQRRQATRDWVAAAANTPPDTVVEVMDDDVPKNSK